jgi:hypothetical protein
LVGEVLNREGQRGWELVTIRQGPDGESAILRRGLDEGLGGEDVFEASAYDGMQAASQAIREENQRRRDEDDAAWLMETEHSERAELLLSAMSEQEVSQLETEAKASLPALLNDRRSVVRAIMRQLVLPADADGLLPHGEGQR